ncbi:hypothetical protein O4H61_20885, partial [Roseovarius aestuarii]|nr:hypothetical protein [Roseovarius aestuarii]
DALDEGLEVVGALTDPVLGDGGVVDELLGDDGLVGGLLGSLLGGGSDDASADEDVIPEALPDVTDALDEGL